MKMTLLFLITFTSFVQAKTSCSDIYTAGSYESLKYIYTRHGTKQGAEVISRLDSVMMLKKVASLVALNKELKKRMIRNERVSSYHVDELRGLRGVELDLFLKKERSEFEYLYFRSSYYYHLPFGLTRSERKLHRNIVKKFYSYVQDNYSSYFLRYIKVLKKQIPWEEIEQIEKGLSLEEVTKALDGLVEKKCEKLFKAYDFKVTLKDLARETLAFYFKNKIYGEKK